MKKILKILYLPLAIFLVIGCQKSDHKKNALVEKEYGKLSSDYDSLGVELNIDQFNNWSELLKRTEKIVCNDSMPKITLKNKEELKTIYFHSPCWDHFGCILIKEKNVIKIHNDSVSKYWEQPYTLDSLDYILRKDIQNYGKDPMLCEKPEKLLISVTYDNEFENLPLTLEKLVTSFENITGKTDINIWLDERIKILPPPPPPIDNKNLN